MLVYSLLMIFLRCLAHVINLATQAVIKAYLKSKFYDPSKPDDHIPDTSGFSRDAVGLVRAICVKVIDYTYTKMYTHFLLEGALVGET
jgi:hypothetical protein